MTNPLPDERTSLWPRPRSQKREQDVNLLKIALGAFVFGVFLHGCVALTVLDGSSVVEETLPAVEEEAESTQTPAPTAAPTQPGQPPDRTSCNEIRGTPYRSQREREFFLANCV